MMGIGADCNCGNMNIYTVRVRQGRAGQGRAPCRIDSPLLLGTVFIVREGALEVDSSWLVCTLLRYQHSQVHRNSSEFFLRPTVSRPVRLGIGSPFGTLDEILSSSSFFSDNYFILLS
jgi:hypothetical protein